MYYSSYSNSGSSSIPTYSSMMIQYFYYAFTYCLAAQVFLGLSILLIVLAPTDEFGIVAKIMMGIFSLAWTSVLALMCSYGRIALSWALAIIPILLMAMLYFGVKYYFSPSPNPVLEKKSESAPAESESEVETEADSAPEKESFMLY